MAIYDYLRISTDKLPLTDKEKEDIGENCEWRTKDFECIFSTAEITDEGKLRFLTFEYVWDKNAESPVFTGGRGAFTRKNEKWVEINKHGYINFYGFVYGKKYKIKQIK